MSIKDFYLGSDKPIEIKLLFEEDFDVSIPDLFGNSQIIKCNGIVLSAKKRDRSAPGRAFNDLVVVEHYYLPVESRGSDGWSITRRTGSALKITERQLALSYASAETPKAFYFGKDRDKQLKKNYNSSLGNIINDLNWRFEKKQRSTVEAEKFKHKRIEIEKHIFENTDGDTLEKTIEQTNTTLRSLNIPEIDLSIIKTLTPYDSSEMVKRFDGFELPISLTGSGIEMIIALIFLETLAKISRSEICIIIDEPELHLHPSLQDKFARHLQEISEESQVFISTHSPFFFRNCFDNIGTKVLISEKEGETVAVKDAKSKGFGLLKWSPSWGEICYFAYSLPTIEFHDDLYASLQDRENKEKVCEIEDWFVNTKSFTKEIGWAGPTNGLYKETLMTYIRNRIHHGDNQNRPMYTPEQLKNSIENMINLIKNP
jgi:hypothetical protein